MIFAITKQARRGEAPDNCYPTAIDALRAVRAGGYAWQVGVGAWKVSRTMKPLPVETSTYLRVRSDGIIEGHVFGAPRSSRTIPFVFGRFDGDTVLLEKTPAKGML